MSALEKALVRLDEEQVRAVLRDPYFLFRDACFELTRLEPRVWTTVQSYLGARAYESAAIQSLPNGAVLSGLRHERITGYDWWIAVIEDGSALVSGSFRRTEAAAILDAGLRAALRREKIRAEMEESFRYG